MPRLPVDPRTPERPAPRATPEDPVTERVPVFLVNLDAVATWLVD